MKISAKVAIIIGIGTLAISIAVGFLSYTYNRNALESKVDKEYSTLADVTMESIDREMMNQYDNLKLAATRIKVRSYLLGKNSEDDRRILNDGLRESVAVYSYWNDVSVIDPDGVIVASSEGGVIGKNISASGGEYENLFLSAIHGKGGYSDIHINGDIPKSSATVSDVEESFMVPVFDQPGGRIIGVVQMCIKWGEFMKVLGNINEPVVNLYNNQGELIGAKDMSGKKMFSAEDKTKPVLVSALASFVKSDIFPNLDDGTESITSITRESGYGEYKGNGWILVTQIPTSTAFSGATKSAVTLSLILVPFIILISLFVIFFINRSVSRPLRILTDEVSEMNSGNLDKDIIVRSKDEIGQLATAFNKMKQALKVSYTSLEGKVEEKTEELNRALEDSRRRNIVLENSRRAMFNILEDFDESRKKVIEKTEELQDALVSIQVERDRSEGILRYLHSIGEGVIATDSNGTLNFVNLTAAKMVARVEGSPLIGKKYAEEFSFVIKIGSDRQPLDPVRETIQKASVYALPPYSCLVGPDKDIPVTGSFAPIIKNKKILGVVSVFQDITERYNLEKEKDEFLSITAHQLRTPLTGIRWTIESLLDGDAGKLPEEAKNYLDQLNENNQRLITLVNDLLDVSRINMGKSKEEVETVDVSNVAKEAVKALNGLAKEKRIKVTLRKKGKSVPQIKIGPKHFFQAMENLVSNAIKYTPKKGQVTVLVEANEQKVLVAVSDNGIGIPEKDQGNIFRKFFRASNAVIQETDGSGLGLSVVKSFVEEAGGRIWFESAEGKGTTFYMDFPADKTTNFLIT